MANIYDTLPAEQAPSAPAPAGNIYDQLDLGPGVPTDVGPVAPKSAAPAPQASAPMRGIHQTFSGFNEMLAKGIGLPVDALDQVYRLMDEDGFLNQPGDARQYMVDKFRQLRLIAPEAEGKLEEFSKNLGGNLFQNMVLLGGWIKAAQGIQAGGTGLRGMVGKMAEATKKATPTQLAAGQAAATVGQTAGGQAVPERYRATGEMAGALVGGGGPAALARLISKIGAAGLGATPGILTSAFQPISGLSLSAIGARTGWMRSRQAFEAIRRLSLKKPASPLMDGTSPMEAAQYAKQALQADKQSVVGAFNLAAKAIGNAPLNPVERSRRLMAAADTAYMKGQKKADVLWKKVDMKEDASSSAQQLYLAAQKVDAGINPLNQAARPKPAAGSDMGALDLIYSMKPKKGKPWRANLGDLKAISSQISARLREQINPAQAHNLGLLHDQVLNLIGTQFGSSKHVRAARDYTKWLHDTFTRGPIGKFRGAEQTSSGYAMTPQGQRARTLLDDERAAAIISQASKKVQMPQLAQEAEALIRSEVMALAEEEAAKAVIGTPPHLVAEAQAKAMKRFLDRRDIQAFMSPKWPAAARDFGQAGAQLQQVLKVGKDIRNSAFYKLAEQDTQSHVKWLMSQPKKAGLAAEMRRGLEQDPLALRGYQNEWIRSLFQRAGSSPTAMDALLKTRGIDTATYEILGNDLFKRLQTNVRAAMEVESRYAGRAAGGVGKVVGNKIDSFLGRTLGATLSQNLPGNTVQRGGQFANVFNAASRWMVGAQDASSLFAMAVMDPKMERVLWSKAPKTVAEFRAQAIMVRKITAAIAAANAGMLGERE